MATKSNARDTASADAETQAAEGQAAIADAARQQMANTASAASVALHVFDSLQQTQHRMIQRAAMLQEQTAERLRHATTPGEVLAIQSSLMMSGWSEMAQYAQELMAATLKVQGELARPGNAQTAARASAASGMSSLSSATAPLFQAWQAMFTPPHNGTAQRHH